MIQEVGAIAYFLPPYSPDNNPIEEAFSKVKAEMKVMEEAQVTDIETIVLAAFSSQSMIVTSGLKIVNLSVTAIHRQSHLKYGSAFNVFIINYCHHVMLFEITCVSQTSFPYMEPIAMGTN